MRPLVLCVLLVLLLLPVRASAAAGDAGSGLDAGATVGTALPVALGSFDGELDRSMGDGADVFRIDLPADAGVRFIVTPLTGTLFLYTLHDEGYVEDGSGASTQPAEVRAVAYGGTVHLGVFAYDDDASYRVEASLMPRSDLGIVEVAVTPLDPLGLRREVRVDIANHGASHLDGALRIRAHHPDGSVRGIVATGSSQLPPGETRPYFFVWQTLGEVGNVLLVVEIRPQHDEMPGDNLRVLETNVLTEGDGTDLLGQRREITAGDARGALWYSALSEGSVPGAWYYANVSTPYAYAETSSLGVRSGFPILDPLFE